MFRVAYKGTWEELRQVNGEMAEIEEEITQLKIQLTVCEEHRAAITAAFQSRIRRHEAN